MDIPYCLLFHVVDTPHTIDDLPLGRAIHLPGYGAAKSALQTVIALLARPGDRRHGCRFINALSVDIAGEVLGHTDKIVVNIELPKPFIQCLVGLHRCTQAEQNRQQASNPTLFHSLPPLSCYYRSLTSLSDHGTIKSRDI